MMDQWHEQIRREMDALPPRRAFFDRARWCWLLGHKWRAVYPQIRKGTPVSDATPYSVCIICEKRR